MGRTEWVFVGLFFIWLFCVATVAVDNQGEREECRAKGGSRIVIDGSYECLRVEKL